MSQDLKHVYPDHYKTGWNDVAYGIKTWSNEGISKWENPLQWAIEMKKIANEIIKANSLASHNEAYYQGVADCVTEYQNTGKVSKK